MPAIVNTMMDSKTTAGVAYRKRMNRVLDYIDLHIDEDMTVDTLSTVAHFSKHHFHRQFLAFSGVNIGRYIQLMKLKRASYRLAFHSHERIIEIALGAGFENPESFSRAFKSVFGQTPSGFRKQPAWDAWSELFRIPLPRRERMDPMNVQIVEVEPTLVAILEHRGSPTVLNDSVQRFIDWRKQSGLSPVASAQTYGVPHNDPNKTPPAEFRFDICGSVTEAVAPNTQGVITGSIPGGRCAVLRHEGSRDRISDSVYDLYGKWLPESGEELRDFPVYFHYLNVEMDTPEHAHLTDIYLPLK